MFAEDEPEGARTFVLDEVLYGISTVKLSCKYPIHYYYVINFNIVNCLAYIVSGDPLLYTELYMQMYRQLIAS